MSVEADLVLGAYSKWLKSVSKVEVLENGVTEFTTPFLDCHNDHLQIYAEKRSPDLFLLTDDGYILAELKSSGVDSRGPKRGELLGRLLDEHDVRYTPQVKFSGRSGLDHLVNFVIPSRDQLLKGCCKYLTLHAGIVLTVFCSLLATRSRPEVWMSYITLC